MVGLTFTHQLDSLTDTLCRWRSGFFFWRRKRMKPMLAGKAPEQLAFPLYASPKIDGIRAVVKDDMLLSRTLKPIPNDYVQETLGVGALNGLDGELTVGPPNAKNVMQATTSGVMSEKGEPDFIWWVFDYWTDTSCPYHKRFNNLLYGMTDAFRERHPRIKLLPQTLIHDAEQLAMYEDVTVQAGFEGIMVRKPEGLYKYGRSTTNEGHLLKIKRFTDSEAVVIGFEEKLHNGNEATTDERGYTKRSSHQENKIPMNTLGALRVRDVTTGIEFSIGSGFDDLTRKKIWDLKSAYLGGLVTYKHFELAGVKSAPRFPTFKAFRDKRDV
jgi:DNA ligase-1